MMDIQIGRWFSLDPLCELSRRWTLYNFSYDNPLRYIDPDGKLVFDWRTNQYVDEEGKVVDPQQAVAQLTQASESLNEVRKDKE